jgi:hypothetical protein
LEFPVPDDALFGVGEFGGFVEAAFLQDGGGGVFLSQGMGDEGRDALVGEGVPDLSPGHLGGVAAVAVSGGYLIAYLYGACCPPL